LLDGTVIANSWSDLTDGTILAPLNVDESGARMGFAYVWTGTTGRGTTVMSETCGNWSSDEFVGTAGNTVATNSYWSRVYAWGCTGRFPLYCFQQ
jgi:hypothetical protein